MKAGVFLSALVVVGGLAANASHAQLHPATARATVKPTPKSSLASAGLRHGSLGGPVNKGPSINGTGVPRKH